MVNHNASERNIVMSNLFSDLDQGEFDAELTSEVEHKFDTSKGLLEQGFSKAKIAKFEQPCKSCKGGGKFISWTGRIVGECFKCKGRGTIFTKTDPRVLEANRVKAKAKRHAAAKQNAEAAAEFLSENAAINDWFTANLAKSSDFAQSLFNQLTTKGALSEGQVAAIEKSIEREAGWAAERAAKEQAKPSNTNLHNAFSKALESGLKRPILRLEGYTFSLAPESGKNAGCVYAKSEEGSYLGKITPEGKFQSVRECSQAAVDFVNNLGSDLFAQAVAYGKATGRCSFCARELTNEKSIELGIGPICKDKWGL